MDKDFRHYKRNTIGHDLKIQTPYGKYELLYADWIASGRLYKGIETKIAKEFGPYVANTHTETTETGTMITLAYHKAHNIIKEHVNASDTDKIITAGFGMTSVINKLQRLMGLRSCGKLINTDCLDKKDKPVVFLTHMEHHSNQTSWYETIADVIVIEPGDDLLVDPKNLEIELEKYKDREIKIGSFSGCSNVSGVFTPYHQLAKIMHKHGGLCFVDFAASAPYVDIDMHPADPEEKLDAIFFSPHKFLGGPGSSGVMVFDAKLYWRNSPDNPGGGTVDWTNPWGEYKYIDDIELREDGGTPGFLQAIRAALSIQLKNEMGVSNIMKQEHKLVIPMLEQLKTINKVHVLADNCTDRIGAISMYIEEVHYNLVVRILNDRYGIQTRGGCACAGTYGHFLLNVTKEQSAKITEMINNGDFSSKPGWIRISLHPTMTLKDINYICSAIEDIKNNISEWQNDYSYSSKTNEFTHKSFNNNYQKRIKKLYTL